MWQLIAAIIGVLLGLISIGTIIYNRIYHDAEKDRDINETKELLKTYNIPEMHLMITTMWQAYTADLPRRRPDLAQNHSPCSLLPAGLDMIPAEVKAELHKIDSLPKDHQSLVTGYLVAKTMGIDRINALARQNQVLVQDMIGILSTYLESCLNEDQESTQ